MKKARDTRQLRHKNDINSLEIWITLFNLPRQGDGSRTQVEEKEEEEEEEEEEEKKDKKEVKRGKDETTDLVLGEETLIMARSSFR